MNDSRSTIGNTNREPLMERLAGHSPFSFYKLSLSSSSRLSANASEANGVIRRHYQETEGSVNHNVWWRWNHMSRGTTRGQPHPGTGGSPGTPFVDLDDSFMDDSCNRRGLLDLQESIAETFTLPQLQTPQDVIRNSRWEVRLRSGNRVGYRPPHRYGPPMRRTYFQNQTAEISIARSANLVHAEFLQEFPQTVEA